MADLDRITFDPQIMAGRACGKRITVAHIVNLVANGMTTDEIVAEHRIWSRRISVKPGAMRQPWRAEPTAATRNVIVEPSCATWG